MRTYKHLITYTQNVDKETSIGDKPFEYQSTMSGMHTVCGLHKVLTTEDIKTIMCTIAEHNKNTKYPVIILNDILLGDLDEN
jgi:hypothetical protein